MSDLISALRALDRRAGRAGSRTPARSGGERARLAMLLVAAVAFVPWVLYWGLLVP